MQTYREIETAFVRGEIDALTAHEALSLVDFQLRLITFIGIRAHMESGGGEIRFGRSPGMGSLLGLLRQIERDDSISLRYPTVRDAVARTRDLFSHSGKTVAGDGIENFKLLRDHLFHAGALPGADEGERAAALCRGLARDLGEVLLELTETLQKRPRKDAVHHRAVINVDGDFLDLWPLIVSYESDEMWRIYSSYSDGVAWFNVPGSAAPRQRGADDELVDDLLTRYLRMPSKDTVYGDFISSVTQDLGSFSPRRSEPLHWDERGEFVIVWTQSTASGDELRHDRFRIGPDDVKQWHDPATDLWRPYQELIKRLVSWPVLRRRLIDLIEDEEQTEAAQLPATQRYFVAPRFQETDLDGQVLEEKVLEAGDFSKLVEAELQKRGPNTTVFFIQGPAGVGKTRSLRRLAATAMEDEHLPSPAFLYVRTSGVSLLDLDQVVSAAVSDTRILTTETVKTLARNGLLVLIIDGFDELLGGRSYDAALESLRPWFDALGGRGVLVVSARSAYFLKHYRTSLVRKAKDSSFGVTHRVFTVVPWTDGQRSEFANLNKISDSVFETFSHTERELLGLPFFASVVVAAAKEGSLEPGKSKLVPLLLEQYLEREGEKLAQGAAPGSEFMTKEELRAFFIELAELLAVEPDRSVDSELVSLAGSAAIGENLDERPGLERRLTVLCGLEATDPNKAQGERLTFGHELYFDYFFSQAIVRVIASASSGRAVPLLASTPIRPWAADLVIEACSSPDVADLLQSSSESRQSESQEVARLSAGELYRAMFASGWSANERSVVSANIDVLDLSASRRGVRLHDVFVEELKLGQLDDGEKVTVTRSHLRSIAYLSDDLSQLELDRASIPIRVVSRAEYVEGEHSVLKHLANRQAVTLDFEPEVTAPRDDYVELFGIFLQRMRDRAVLTPVIESDSRMPNDPRLKWVADNPEGWQAFLRALEASGAARMDTFAASGAKPLVKLKLKVGFDELESPPGSTDVARSFWDIAREPK